VREELALFGGPKTTAEPFPQWPRFTEKALADVAEPLRTGRVGYWAGPRGREFEEQWAAWAGAAHAVSCSSGTAALHLALAALGIGPGDEVIVPSHTFISTSLAVLQAGAAPAFCDVCEDQTLDPRGIEPLAGPRTKAVIVVHLFGIVCAMDRILETARRLGLAVVEDCAQCIGGEHRSRRAGTLGIAGCFSFSQTKHLSTAGEGGMVVTGDDGLAEACRSLRDYGRAASADGNGDTHVRAGFNYRLTEIQSVVGLNELSRLDTWNLPRRRGFAKAYDHAFAQLYGVKALPLHTADRANAYWKYPLQVDLEKLTCTCAELRAAIAAEGIPDCGGRWRQSYEEPVFAAGGRQQAAAVAGAGAGAARCPTAEALRDRTLLLGLHPTWERSHIELCIAAVKKVLRVFKR
jgi:dTDP-4-amino-4,6-dideoxygalactose transaminase